MLGWDGSLMHCKSQRLLVPSLDACPRLYPKSAPKFTLPRQATGPKPQLNTQRQTKRRQARRDFRAAAFDLSPIAIRFYHTRQELAGAMG